MPSRIGQILVREILNRQREVRQREQEWDESLKPVQRSADGNLVQLGQQPLPGRQIGNTQIPANTPLKTYSTETDICAKVISRPIEEPELRRLQLPKSWIMFGVQLSDRYEIWVQDKAGSRIKYGEFLNSPVIAWYRFEELDDSAFTLNFTLDGTSVVQEAVNTDPGLLAFNWGFTHKANQFWAAGIVFDLTLSVDSFSAVTAQSSPFNAEAVSRYFRNGVDNAFARVTTSGSNITPVEYTPTGSGGGDPEFDLFLSGEHDFDSVDPGETITVTSSQAIEIRHPTTRSLLSITQNRKFFPLVFTPFEMLYIDTVYQPPQNRVVNIRGPFFGGTPPGTSIASEPDNWRDFLANFDATQPVSDIPCLNTFATSSTQNIIGDKVVSFNLGDGVASERDVLTQNINIEIQSQTINLDNTTSCEITDPVTIRREVFMQIDPEDFGVVADNIDILARSAIL